MKNRNFLGKAVLAGILGLFCSFDSIKAEEIRTRTVIKNPPVARIHVLPVARVHMLPVANVVESRPVITAPAVCNGPSCTASTVETVGPIRRFIRRGF